MAEPITLDELSAELQRLGVPAAAESGDGVSVRELSLAWFGNVGKAAVERSRFVMQRALAAGAAVCLGRGPRPAMDGTTRQVPLYKFHTLSPSKKKGGSRG